MERDSEVHVPVLLREVLDLVALKEGATVLDATVGAGGHAEAILDRIGPAGILIGTDRDPEILAKAREGLARFGDRARLFHSRLSSADSVLEREGIAALDAFLLDLGVSSFQLDRPERGFSFSQDGPLDMRMDPEEETPTAAEIVNRTPEKELADLIYRFGEEGRSRKIAAAIVERRKREPFARTLDLAQWIEARIGRREKIHPATRTFQALRIAVNEELNELRAGLARLMARLRPGGRGAVISFHSLEDRIVKEVFREACRSGGFRSLTKKPATASREERERNRRSRSAKLRAIERI